MMDRSTERPDTGRLMILLAGYRSGRDVDYATSKLMPVSSRRTVVENTKLKCRRDILT